MQKQHKKPPVETGGFHQTTKHEMNLSSVVN